MNQNCLIKNSLVFLRFFKVVPEERVVVTDDQPLEIILLQFFPGVLQNCIGF